MSQRAAVYRTYCSDGCPSLGTHKVIFLSHHPTSYTSKHLHSHLILIYSFSSPSLSSLPLALCTAVFVVSVWVSLCHSPPAVLLILVFVILAERCSLSHNLCEFFEWAAQWRLAFTSVAVCCGGACSFCCLSSHILCDRVIVLSVSS